MHSDREWSFSENKKYAINHEQEDILFIRYDDESSPHRFLIEIKDDNDISPPDDNYRAYTFFKRFSCRAENDCLLFAEGMSIYKFPYLNEECLYREKITRRDFGYSDDQNVEIAKEIGAFRKSYCGGDEIVNHRVNPQVGECYVIMVSDDIPDGQIPYHVGYVLFKDGNTNITIEATAGGRNKRPLFNIYAAAGGGDATAGSFHDVYRDIFVIYGYNGEMLEPVTSILEPV